jgi:hypothetical protein
MNVSGFSKHASISFSVFLNITSSIFIDLGRCYFVLLLEWNWVGEHLVLVLNFACMYLVPLAHVIGPIFIHSPFHYLGFALSSMLLGMLLCTLWALLLCSAARTDVASMVFGLRSVVKVLLSLLWCFPVLCLVFFCSWLYALVVDNVPDLCLDAAGCFGTALLAFPSAWTCA